MLALFRDHLILISHKTTRVVKTCPPSMFDELEDRKSYENHVIDSEKMVFDVTNDVKTP